MAETTANFDAYHKWLGIPPADQPPNHYQILGVRLFEDDRDVISNAADQRMRHVRTFQSGKHSELSQQILNELSSARLCLLRPEKKAAYDQVLRARQSASAASATVVADFSAELFDNGAAAPTPRKRTTPARKPKPRLQVWQIGAAAVVGVLIAIGIGYAVVMQRGDSLVAKKPPDAKVADPAPDPPVKAESKIPQIEPTAPDSTTTVDSKPATPAAPNPPEAARANPAAANPVKPAKADDPAVPAYEKRPDLSHEEVVKPPPPATEFTPEQQKQFAKSIGEARKLLARYDSVYANVELNKAAAVVGADAKMPDKQYQELTRLRNLSALVQTGVDELHKGLADLRIGDEIALNTGDKLTGTVARRDRGALIVKVEGHSGDLTINVSKISPGLAQRIEDKTFKRRTVESVAALAAMHTVHAHGNRDEAKRLFDKAAAAGMDVKNLLAELPSGFPLDHGKIELASSKNPAETKTPGEATPPAVEPTKKLPIPSDEAQQKARGQINELFGNDLTKAKKAEEKSALANILATKARETTDNPTDRYVLWTMARDVAADAGDAAAMMQAIDGLTLDYDIDALAMKADGISRAAKASLGAAPAKELCENVLALVSEAVTAENFTLANKLMAVATTLSGRAKDANTGKAVAAAHKEIVEFQKVSDAAKKAVETLKQTPDDPDANLTLGMQLCFSKDDWDQGLPHLAKGSNDDLKAIATAELAKPGEAAAQVDLGDLWWAFGDKTPASKLAYEKRAAVWYEKAQPQLSGLATVKVTKRLKQLEDAVAASDSPANGGIRAKVGKKASYDVESLSTGWTGMTPPAQVITVRITKTDKAVILVLHGMSGQVWNVELGPRVTVKGIVLERNVQRVNAPKGIPVISGAAMAGETYPQTIERITGIADLPKPNGTHVHLPVTAPVIIGP